MSGAGPGAPRAVFRPPSPQALTVDGPAGAIAALLEVPEAYDGRRMAVVCHPHPLFGGTMQNKVVHTTARALNEQGYATLRFNFRGVGASAGTFDEGRGETLDALAVCDEATRRWPGAALSLAGFSFGSFVAYRAAAARPTERLLLIAPPVQRFDFAVYPSPRMPWIVIQGDRDELVDHAQVLEWTRSVVPAPVVVLFEGAEHFFHGRLNDLRDAVRAHFPGA